MNHLHFTHLSAIGFAQKWLTDGHQLGRKSQHLAPPRCEPRGRGGSEIQPIPGGVEVRAGTLSAGGTVDGASSFFRVEMAIPWGATPPFSDTSKDRIWLVIYMKLYHISSDIPTIIRQKSWFYDKYYANPQKIEKNIMYFTIL